MRLQPSSCVRDRPSVRTLASIALPLMLVLATAAPLMSTERTAIEEYIRTANEPRVNDMVPRRVHFIDMEQLRREILIRRSLRRSPTETADAPTLEPATIELELFPGDSHDETKTLEIPDLDDVPVDIVFAIDTTGSMGDAITRIRTELDDIISELELEFVDLAMGLVNFRDHAGPLAAEHARQLFHAIRTGNVDDGGPGATVADPLAHAEVAVGIGRHLRQVGHAEQLVRPGQCLKTRAHRVGDGAADPRIDLVEDQDAPFLCALGDDVKRQHHPREFAAGGDLPQRLPFN